MKALLTLAILVCLTSPVAAQRWVNEIETDNWGDRIASGPTATKQSSSWDNLPQDTPEVYFSTISIDSDGGVKDSPSVALRWIGDQQPGKLLLGHFEAKVYGERIEMKISGFYYGEVQAAYLMDASKIIDFFKQAVGEVRITIEADPQLGQTMPVRFKVNANGFTATWNALSRIDVEPIKNERLKGKTGSQTLEELEEANHPPKLINWTLPEYPQAARHAGFEGIVLVEIVVGEDGSVLSAEVAKSSTHESLDAAAVEAAKKYLFESAKADGISVKDTVAVPFEFSLE